MKLDKVIEGGLAGVSTLALLQETLHGIDGHMPRALPLVKKWKKQSKKGGSPSSELFVQLAGELLAGAAFFGLAGIGRRKNAVLRGALLGAGAGVAAAFLQNDEDKAGDVVLPQDKRRQLLQRLLTVGLYTAGGVLAGTAVQKLDGKKLRKMKKKAKALKRKKK
ncbi:hypothetical protein [Flaviaesturariibacter amylovorans]|uniref:DUF4126 family protein n=1 Tax=Flaviaesturariibacter amylovorans TaxID=1084520 RepID=A0ABP8HMG9_9BACT